VRWVGEALGCRLKVLHAHLAALLDAAIHTDAVADFSEIWQFHCEHLEAIGTDLNHLAKQLAILADDAGGLSREHSPGGDGAFDAGSSTVFDEGLMTEQADDLTVQAFLGGGVQRGREGGQKRFGGQACGAGFEVLNRRLGQDCLEAEEKEKQALEGPG
jgi:hypothetical protein